MEDNKDTRKTGVPSLPVEDILLDVARSVVQAQQALDTSSLDSEVRIREAGLDKQFGLSAHWYTIPELSLDLRLALELGNRGEVKTQMVDAEYQSRYGFDVSASSLLQTRIVAVPPGEGKGLSLLDKRTVLQRTGMIKRVVEAYADADAPYFVIRYRPFVKQGYDGGLWYVMLLDVLLSGRRKLKALTVIDDATGDVVRLWTDAENEPVTVDGVTFTPEQAARVVHLANTATVEELEEIGLTGSAALAVEESRPLENIRELAEVKYLGQKSLEKLLARVTGGAETAE